MMMTRGEKTQFIGGAIAFVPYLLIVWGGAHVLEVTLVKALSWLVGIRLLFTLVETVGGALAWRLNGRRKTIDGFVELLRANNYPKRTYRDDDFLSYLARIESDEGASAKLLSNAREMQALLGIYENVGILPGMRMHSASDAALDIYSPKAEAPK